MIAGIEAPAIDATILLSTKDSEELSVRFVLLGLGYATLTFSMVVYLPVKISSMLSVVLNGKLFKKLEYLKTELVIPLKQRVSCGESGLAPGLCLLWGDWQRELCITPRSFDKLRMTPKNPCPCHVEALEASCFDIFTTYAKVSFKNRDH